MKIKKATLFLMLWAAVISSAYSNELKELEKKVVALNSQSMKSLGISLNALHFLVGADPNNYHLYSHLEQSGEIKFIRELENKGYVKTQKMRGLPDGGQPADTYLRIIALGKGVELQRCMVALQHNSNLQADSKAPLK